MKEEGQQLIELSNYLLGMKEHQVRAIFMSVLDDMSAKLSVIGGILQDILEELRDK